MSLRRSQLLSAITILCSIDIAAAQVLPPVFSTYLGGSGADGVRDIAVDSAGNIYAAGGSPSTDFQTTPGVIQPQKNPLTPDTPGVTNSDAFVVKYSPTGQVLWSTFLGGPNHDRAYAIGVDSSGNVTIAGRAGRAFPTTAGSFQPAFAGGPADPAYGPQDGFVAKLSNDGRTLIYSSYFGAPDKSIVRDVAVNPAGEAYLASAFTPGFGSYSSSTQTRFLNSPLGTTDSVVAKISTDGSQVLWARYVGGSSLEFNESSIALDGAGNPYFLFTTESSNAATAGAADTSYAGSQDMVMAKFTPAGALSWATYFGGPGNESTETHELAVDSAGNSYIAGPTTLNSGITVTPGAYRSPNLGGGNDTFVVKISPNGSQFLKIALIGGSANDRAEGVAVDSQGRIVFTGTTQSADFPTTSNAFRRTMVGVTEAMVVRLSSDFTQLLYASYFGGSLIESGRAGAAGPNDELLIGGETSSLDLFTANAAQPSHGGGNSDAYISKFVFPASDTVAPGAPTNFH